MTEGKKTEGVLEFGARTKPKNPGKAPWHELPENAEAREDALTYLALCSLGVVHENKLAYASRLREVFGIPCGDSTYGRFLRRDPEAQELVAWWKSKGPETETVKRWHDRAREVAKDA